MEKTVYIDVLFVLNTTINYLLLLASAKIADCEHSRPRILLAAVIGGVYAALVYFPALSFLYEAAVRILFAAVMVAVSFGFTKVSVLVRMFLVFLAVSFAFGGGVLAWQAAFSGVDLHNGIIYIDMTLRNLIFSSALLYLVLELLFRRAASKREGVRFTTADITDGDRNMTLNVLYDTGCTLADPINGRRVLLVGLSDFMRMIPADAAEQLKSMKGVAPATQLSRMARLSSAHRFRLIPYSAVGSEGGMLLAYRPDEVKVEGANRAAALVACSPGELSDGRRFRAVIGV
jgi:stage II sporulation protein GA (sporulation sigma-E factor processing peptidase)